MEIFLLILFFLCCRFYLKLPVLVLRYIPLALVASTLVVTLIAGFLTTTGTLPIKPDQQSYLLIGSKLAEYPLSELKQMMRSFFPEIKFHYGMWYLTAIVHKVSFYPPLAMRLLNLLLHLFGGVLLLKVIRDKVNDVVAFKVVIFYLLTPSLLIFTQLYLKDTILLFLSILLVYGLYFKNWPSLISVVFFQYHFRMPLLVFSTVISINYFLMIKIKRASFRILMVLLQFLVLVVVAKIDFSYPEKLKLVVGGLKYVCTNFENLYQFVSSFALESLGFAFMVRPESKLSFGFLKVLMSRLVIWDSLIIPALAVIYGVRDLVRAKFEVILLGLIPLLLYYLIYYYNYNHLGNNALYSFRISLPVHVLMLLYVLIRYFGTNENNLRRR